MSEWETIDSAPKDGSLIWLLLNGNAHIGHYELPNGWGENDSGAWVLKTTFTGRGGIASCCHRCSSDQAPTHWVWMFPEIPVA